ncbi:MAG TPA: MmgE/PrpD family protein [Burkholderiales bacterium]|nr:MmgE/PrpD family protein [Burkholderiales bacterium]
MPGATEGLLELVRDLALSKLPRSVVENAKWCVLDTLGCGLYGSREAWSEIMASEIGDEAPRGTSTILGRTGGVSAPAAALCNGTASHGFELDDLLDEAIVHPGAIVVPAAIAAAEAADAPGERVLLGVIAGYEVMDRVGLALGLEPAHRGFHKTSLAGPIGAAVAAGVVMKLSLGELQSSVGLACSAASGIKTFATGSGGGMMKRMHAGRSAEAGVRMAQLAARGFSGPPNAIEGRFGVLEVFGGETAQPDLIGKDLGERWAVNRVFVKVFPCCSWIQAPVQQLVALRGAQPLAASQIEAVRIGVNSYARRINGEPAPVDTMGAQYSIPYCTALALTGNPHDPAMYSGGALEDASRRALASKVELFVDPEMEAVYPRHYGASVEVRLADGRKLPSSILDPHGMPADPVTESERLQKFSRLASRVLPPQTVERAVQSVRTLDRLRSARELAAALR